MLTLSLRRSRGFTLVELLVVIAIIGVLVALLLPAVQAAREAARRSSCGNNMKQLSIAVHNFHDTHKVLPPGGTADNRPFGTNTPNGTGWGSSWFVQILPFIEQGTLYEKLQLGPSSAWGTADTTNNNTAANGLLIKSFVCPSSPLEPWARGPYSPPAGAKIVAPSYVGVSGAVDGLIPGYAESRISTPGGSAGCCSGGIISAAGVLFPGSENVKSMGSITDGTSNTLMIGEASDFLITVTGKKQDYRSSYVHGFMIGWHTYRSPPNSGSGGDNRTFNMVTLRYPINDKKKGGTGFADLPGNCGSEGVCDNASSNTPFNSAHPSGAMFALADGSVRMLSTQTDLATVARLCTRDDGQAVTFE